MMCHTALLYSDKYFDYCSEGHPYWNIERFSIVFELARSLGWLDENSSLLEIHEPRIATNEELLSFHHQRYIDTLRELSTTGHGSAPEYGLGFGDNPVFKGVHEASSLITGGAIELVDLVAAGKVDHGFGFLNGLHHALPASASGFCYYNDPVIAIKRMLDKGFKRILYIDTDAHHGDGTQLAFYDSKEVLTISFHESGRFLFPGTGDVYETGKGEGTGYSINVPLLPYTTDDIWQKAFDGIVPRIWKAFNPDFVYWQCGADGHYKDPLTRLQLTNNLYRNLAVKIHQMTHETAGGRIVLGGGGGYDPVETAKTWTMILAELAGINLPDTVPQAWIDYCSDKWGVTVEEDYNNKEVKLNEENKGVFNEYIDSLTSEIKEKIFPIHGC
ncbi:MAG: acetoin utilization protein AcuC [Candidatus Hodarchaeales archaeon]